jgi:hypothetical protein
MLRDLTNFVVSLHDKRMKKIAQAIYTPLPATVWRKGKDHAAL